MKNIAIIAEYNPLHNGHLYQMSQLNSESNNIIVALSGNFTERGDIAVQNKYTRAKFAIENGASMVVEIPTFGVLSCAEHYAKCASKVLSLLGSIDELNFGSESGDIDTLQKIAELEEDESVKKLLSINLDKGMSYPKAMSSALSSKLSYDIDNILDKPNNILGIEYIRALSATDIVPTTIKRQGNNYNDKILSNGKFASATSIRTNLDKAETASYLPSEVLKSMRSIDINKDILFYNLYQKLVVDNDDISNILNINEGIDNRIRDALKASHNLDELLDNIKTKRYTLARIKRTLLDILLDIDKDMSSNIDSLDYVTILAIKRDKLSLISGINANIITKYNDYKKTSHPFSELDIKANSLYNLLSTDKITSHQMIIVE